MGAPGVARTGSLCVDFRFSAMRCCVCRRKDDVSQQRDNSEMAGGLGKNLYFTRSDEGVGSANHADGFVREGQLISSRV